MEMYKKILSITILVLYKCSRDNVILLYHVCKDIQYLSQVYNTPFNRSAFVMEYRLIILSTQQTACYRFLISMNHQAFDAQLFLELVLDISPDPI